MPGKQTILVVDDLGVDRLLLRRMLEGRGYKVLEAADGEEGLEVARFHEPDLIISDTLMPKMDGFHFLRNIKKDASTKAIPVILYSAVYTGHRDEKLALSLGANAFIQKPIETEKFLLKVEAAIQGVKAGKETAIEELIEEEEEYLRRYSQVVAAKLEEKVRELEATNECLQLRIVEELEVEDALRVSEEKYRVLFETAKDAIFLSDEGGRFVDVNQAACESLGYSKEELLKLSNREIDAGPTGYEAFLQVRNGSAKEAIFEVNQRRKDGALLPVEITGKFFESDGRRISLAIARDITEHKRAEDRIKASLKEKEVLLQEIHHRVKNNLQVVSSLLDMQARRTRNEDTIDAITESRNRINTMALIHAQLYESSNLSEINMKAFVDKLLMQLLRSYQVQDTKIAPIVSVADYPVPIFMAVPVGLIINELLSNALKYAFVDRKEGTIKVSLVASEEGKINLTVSDDGIGLPDGFDINATKTLGLRLIKILTEDQLRGNLEVVSKEGTTFNIEFDIRTNGRV